MIAIDATKTTTGHGGYILDDDHGEEDDGYDETLVPVDYASAGHIRDDDLYSTLVSAMPSGATLVSVMDCCHSATVLDLPYKYKATGNGWTGISTTTPTTGGGYGSSSSNGGGCGLSFHKLLGILALMSFLFVVATSVHHFITK